MGGAPTMQGGAEQAVWVVILASGGHFAAAVFRHCSDARREIPCFETAEHKTFHRYVVR